MTPAGTVARFPFLPRIPALGEASLAPLVPIALAHRNRIDVNGLVDSGAAVNVLPRAIGRQLGFVWDQQTTSVRSSGNLGNLEARGVVVEAVPHPFAPVRLVFAWADSDDVTLLLGQLNFFTTFDVCFHRLRQMVEIRVAQANTDAT